MDSNAIYIHNHYKTSMIYTINSIEHLRRKQWIILLN